MCLVEHLHQPCQRPVECAYFSLCVACFWSAATSLTVCTVHIWCVLYYNAIFAAYALHRLSYIQYIFWLPKVQALIKKTTICISSFILNSVSFVLQVCSIEFSFSELIEFCSIFTHFLRMEKSADEYTSQFIVLRTVYTTRVTLCTTPGIKTSAVTNQPLPGLFVWIEKLIKAHFSFFLF